MKNIVILYDGANCLDGFSGAWVAWKKFGRKADYIPVFHQAPPPTGLKNKEIYLIDFTFPVDIIKKLIKNNKRVIGIDHHISAKETIKLTHNYSFSSKKNSAAILAWNYFYPKKTIPKLLRYVEDMDLWRFKIPCTKEILAFINIFDFDFKIWSRIAADLERSETRKGYIKKGALILLYQNKLVEHLVKNAQLVKFAGHKVLTVNSPILTSEIGNALSKRHPPMAIIWSQRRNKIKVDLRSNGKIDISKIAKHFGGGGHKAASGFYLRLNQKLPWKNL